MAAFSLNKYHQAIKQEVTAPIQRLVSNARRSISFFLTERKSALQFVVQSYSLEELSDQAALNRVFLRLKSAFGGFIDLGLITDDGVQQAYVGPYKLLGKNYREQAWFGETVLRGSHVSSVFKGFRGLPHIVIAVKHERGDGRFYVLRATLDAKGINNIIDNLHLQHSTDAFLVNHQAILQTPSANYGRVLDKLPFGLPPASKHSRVTEVVDNENSPIFLGYGQIEDSPFILMMIRPSEEAMAGWRSLVSEMVVFLVVSILIIVGVALRVSTMLIGRIYEADHKRAVSLHEMEYTNRMASIGRLAAGVAHEINNPLAIINEKAGLMKDYIQIMGDFEHQEKFAALVDSVLNSVKRCRDITHRLLGFARHMKVEYEAIDIAVLIQEVLSFLGKEAEYRNIRINVDIPPDLPTIYSDRGQLQQVFLNLINNALAALDEYGRIDITAEQQDPEHIVVSVADNGVGIPPENIDRIFEPFFTTKGAKGTGLGLSITYGIVKKLGGSLQAESEVGRGTRFRVSLPLSHRPS